MSFEQFIVIAGPLSIGVPLWGLWRAARREHGVSRSKVLAALMSLSALAVVVLLLIFRPPMVEWPPVVLVGLCAGMIVTMTMLVILQRTDLADTSVRRRIAGLLGAQSHRGCAAESTAE